MFFMFHLKLTVLKKKLEETHVAGLIKKIRQYQEWCDV